jgi:polysaccharide biosynthesis protein PslH
MSRMRILFVSSYPASPPTYGGQRRLEGLMSSLARHHEVSAAALANPTFDRAAAERAMREYCTDLALVESRSERFPKRLVQLRSLVSSRSFEANFNALPAFQDAIDRLLTKSAFDFVLASAGLGLTRYRLDRSPAGKPAPRVILDEHNIEFDLQRQMQTAGNAARRLHHAINWRKVRREETGDWGSLDGVTFTSVPDQERALAIVPWLRSAVVPNAVDLAAFEPRAGDPKPDGVTLMFFGINDYYPNTDGILYFIRDVWPRIARSRPDARLKIVGPHPTPEILAQASDRIEIAGKVDDLRLHLASAGAVIVPLRIGGGTRFKVLEAMAMAKPIVSTTIGAEGIDIVHEKHLLLADDAEQFAQAVGRVLDDSDLAARLGKEGRALVQARYSWDAAAEQMGAFLEEVRAAPPGPRLRAPGPIAENVETHTGPLAAAARWAAAQAWRATGRAARDRELLYGGSTGLRIVTFHETLGADLEQLEQTVDWCRGRWPMARPEDADAILEGRWPYDTDRILVTFDDGWDSNFAAAEWLARQGISAVFFVVPSLIGRTPTEYLRFHEAFHVKADVPMSSSGAKGLTAVQLREMKAMGHRIGAHNFGHRDLGRLHALADIRYEVDNATDALGDVLGAPCVDFAIAFGQPFNVSDEAIVHLKARDLRVSSCHRGLNVPGKTPSFLLRHACEPDHPTAFTRVCIEGGGDRHLFESARLMVRRVGALPIA